jgi:hypothetical protein
MQLGEVLLRCLLAGRQAGQTEFNEFKTTNLNVVYKLLVVCLAHLLAST